MTTPTIYDALTAIRNAREKHYDLVNENSDQISNYEELIKRISKTGYHVLSDCIRNPRGEHIAELYHFNKSIRMTKKDPHFIGIIDDHVQRKLEPSNPPTLTLQEKIEKIEKRIFSHWNGDRDEEAVLDKILEDEIYSLIEKHYKNYPK